MFIFLLLGLTLTPRCCSQATAWGSGRSDNNKGWGSMKAFSCCQHLVLDPHELPSLIDVNKRYQVGQSLCEPDSPLSLWFWSLWSSLLLKTDYKCLLVSTALHICWINLCWNVCSLSNRLGWKTVFKCLLQEYSDWDSLNSNLFCATL